MTRGTLTKVIGACCGLGAFAVAVVAGIAAENPGEVVLFRALVSMLVCQIVGLGVGAVVEKVISDSIRSHKRSRPDPTVTAGSSGVSTAGAAGS